MLRVEGLGLLPELLLEGWPHNVVCATPSAQKVDVDRILLSDSVSSVPNSGIGFRV